MFVTGGAEGIGKAIVASFCQAGHQVAFCDINEVAGQQIAQNSGATFYPVDVSDKDALESCMQHILKEWGDIDIIVNNVGISKFSPITETSVEDFDKILSICVRFSSPHVHSLSIVKVCPLLMYMEELSIFALQDI